MNRLPRLLAGVPTVAAVLLGIMDNVDRIRSAKDYLDWSRLHLRGLLAEKSQPSAVSGASRDAQHAADLPASARPTPVPPSRIAHVGTRDADGREISCSTFEAILAIDLYAVDGTKPRRVSLLP